MTDAELAIGVLALLLLGRRTSVPSGGWAWPVADLPSSPALITQGVGARHAGVDITYRLDSGYGAPAGTLIRAARAGRVRLAQHTPRGWAVILDHGDGWSTLYQHLTGVTVGAGAGVELGQVLGEMGADPLDPQHVVHLHFALWRGGYGDAYAVDPAPAMAGWPRG